MDDIAFPRWVLTSPVFAFASALSRCIIRETHLKINPSQNSPSQFTRYRDDFGESCRDREANLANTMVCPKDTAAKMMRQSTVERDDSDLSCMLSTSSFVDSGTLRERWAKFVNRTNFSDHFIRDGRELSETALSEAPPHDPVDARPTVPRVTLLGANHASGAFTNLTNDAGILQDSRVQRLMKLSCLSKFVQCELHTKAVRISAKHAAAITALMAFAVECRHRASTVSAGLCLECSFLFSSFVSRLRDYSFCEGVDIKGFVAAIIACGLCLRNEDLLIYRSSVNCKKWESLEDSDRDGRLFGFDPRIIDNAILTCISGTIDGGVSNPIMLGALQGLAFTHSRIPRYLSPSLVDRLLQLTNEFVQTPHRRDLSYKRFLSCLLEAMAGSRVIDHRHIHGWATATIQRTYILRSLFQRENLHARVVAAVLTLLVRQYQEKVMEYLSVGGRKGDLPEFKEENKAIGLVWETLQEAMTAWKEICTRPATLYGTNLRVLIESLLRIDLERLRCVHLLKEALAPKIAPVLTRESSSASVETERPKKLSADPKIEQVSSPVLHSSDAMLNHLKARDYTPYNPSDDEEQLRVCILSNILRFLLLPTSIMNAIHKDNTQMHQLRCYLLGQCTSVMAIVSSGVPITRITTNYEHGNSELHYPLTENGRSTDEYGYCCFETRHGAWAAPARFSSQKRNVQLSNWYYHKVAVITRELTRIVTCVSGEPSSSSNPNTSGAFGRPLGTKDTDTIEAAAACLQCMCSNESTICSFVLSEVIDAILQVLLDKKDTSENNQTYSENAKQTAHRLTLCFDTLTSIVVPMHYSFTHLFQRGDLARYAQLLCDIYEDSLRQVLVANQKRETDHVGKTDALKFDEAKAASKRLIKDLPTPIMTATADGFWKLVVRLSERQHVIACDAAKQLNNHDGAEDGDTRTQRARYLKLLNEESEDVVLLIEGAIRCVLNIAWPGLGILYQHPLHGASLEPKGMAELALVCIGQFLKPLCLLFNLSALFPIRSLNDGILAHAEKTRCIATEDYREQHIHWYVYCPTRTEALMSQPNKDSKEGVEASTAANCQGLQVQSLSEFRSYWLLLTYYGFTFDALALTRARLCKGDHTKPQDIEKRCFINEAQARHIRLLAVSAAPLLQMQSSDMHQAIVDIDVLFRYMGNNSGFIHDNVPRSRRQVGHILRNMCGGKRCWNKLKASEQFLMHALTNLEMLRASSGFISNLTLYHFFDAYEFLALPAIRSRLHHIVLASSEIYLSALRTFLPNVAYQLVSKDIYQLVLLLGFSLASVRESARIILRMIIGAFPAYATCGSGLQLLWSIINLVERGSASDIADFCRKVNLNLTPENLTEVNSNDRQRHLRMLRAEAKWWMYEATDRAALALSHTSLRYIESGNVPTGFMLSMEKIGNTHLVTPVSTQQENMPKGANRSQYRSLGLSSGINYLAIAEEDLHSYIQAFIKHNSAKELVAFALRMSPIHVVETGILGQLCEKIQHRLGLTATSNLPKGANDAKDMARTRRGAANRLHELDTLMCLAVASMTTGFLSPSGTIQFFRYLVQGPIEIFESDILHAAIGCWRRLLASDCSNFVLPLLIQITKGVAWTVSRQKGLFDGVHPRQSEEVQTGICAEASAMEHAPYAQSYSRNSPHTLLFIFLSNTYLNTEYPWALDRSILLTLYHLATRMVEYPSRMSLKGSSFADTMHAAVLVGKICRTLHDVTIQGQKEALVGIIPCESIGVLRQRWYTSLLQWFQGSRPSWYFTDDPPQALEMMKVLESLICLLEEEHALLTQSTSGFLSLDTSAARANSDSTVDLPAFCSNLWGTAHVARDHIEALRLKLVTKQTSKFVEQEQARLLDFLKLLQVLICHELIRLRVWQTPRRTFRITNACIISATGVKLAHGVEWPWEMLVQIAAQHEPTVLVAMVARFPSFLRVRALASRYVVQSPERYGTIPEAVDLYITKETLNAGAPGLQYFANCSIIQALRYLDKRYMNYPSVISYAIRSLFAQQSDNLIFYLPQILQILAYDESGSIQKFLTHMCDKSTIFSHQLLWALQTEGHGDSLLATICRRLSLAVQSRFNETGRTFYLNEFRYINLLTSLSGELVKFGKSQRKLNLRLRLQDTTFHDPFVNQHLYLPTDPTWRIVKVIPDTAVALQSAAKCPILVQFRCMRRGFEDMQPSCGPLCTQGSPSHERHHGTNHPEGSAREGEGSVVKTCIFKMGDDCRQDQLSYQLICLMKRILDTMNVPSFLHPYRVLTTDHECGILEYVPRTMSRNDIGKLVESNIAEYFVRTFGHPESVSFSRARDNFLKSVASYSVVSYILNIKDRHNGNILIDAKGHVVHIDFGFLFDSSPGGDINFESSPFKLTTEMVQLIGKDVGYKSNLHSSSLAKALIDPDRYVLFKEQVIRCYLAVRQYSAEICTLVELMLHSGLPCFKPQKTIADLKHRLAVSKCEIEAAHFMRCQIHESRENYRTRLYDAYQHFVEGIEM
ncbi:unnamed protein product [Phytomonas sp. Hart1]|nr:unnamed protein product [Phytomonas sp. Hart1]|eukprot:CCW67363.1 unnamed protein product [Phytomonas sp. isolate Hart1]